MEALETLIRDLTVRVDRFSEKKGYGDSYAYKYGAFNAALYEVLDGILTMDQIQEAERRVSKIYSSVIDN